MRVNPAFDIQPGNTKGSLWIFLAAGLVESAFFGQLIAFTPLYLPELGVDPGKAGYFTGLIASVTMFIVIPALQKWGQLADQLTRKQVIVQSFLLNAAVAGAAILAGNVWIFLFGRAITLLAMDTNGLILNFLEKSQPGQPRSAITLMAFAPQLGVFLGPLAAGFFLDRLGFRSIIAFNLVLLLLISFLLHTRIQSINVVEEQKPVMGILRNSLGMVIRSPRLSLLYLALTLLVAAWILVFAYLPLSVTSLTPEIGAGGAVGLVLGLGGAAGILVSSALTHLGRRSSEWGVLVFVVLCGSLLSILPAEAGNFSQLILLWMLISGCASAGFTLLYRVIASSAARLNVALVLSLAILPVNGGMILGPVIGSFLAVPVIRGVYPAAMVLNLIALAVLILATRLPIPGENQDAG